MDLGGSRRGGPPQQARGGKCPFSTRPPKHPRRVAAGRMTGSPHRLYGVETSFAPIWNVW